MTSPTRVVIVDDSALSRAILTKILEQDGDIRIVGEAANGLEAVPRIEQLKPDLVTMDVDMPGPNGLETIERIMHTCPVPILVVTGERLGPESDLGFRAIQLGALDFMAKPPITDDDSTAALRMQVRTLSKVPVFLQVERDEGEKVSTAIHPTTARPLDDDVEPVGRHYSVVAIVSGTGGPKALSAIVNALPRDFTCSVLVVQHLPNRFTRAFAKFIEATTSLRVRVVQGLPHELVPGEIVLCESDAHLFIPRKGVVVGSDAPPYAGHRPSATVLLRSVAEVYGRESIGIILSGNGDDGVEGMSAMRAAGALTLAESPATALVGDLPQAAIAAGAISRSMPHEMLADFLVATVSNASSKTTAPPSQPD